MIAAAALLAVGFLPFEQAMPARASTVVSGASVSAKVASASDEATAFADAEAQGVRVEILPDRTASSQTFANPDGTLTTEASEGARWFQDASAPEGWRRVDLDLKVNADGTISPKYPVDDLTLNGGGTSGSGQPLLTAGTPDGKSVSLGWTAGMLPAPVISGNTATYKNVRPGQDLVIQATTTGFEQSLVLQAPPADAADARLSLPVVSHGLMFKDHGDSDVTVNTTAGAQIGGVGAAVTSDASEGVASGVPGASDDAQVTVAQSGSSSSLVVAPTQQFLDTATYPVTVDPSVSLQVGTDTWVNSASPDTHYDTDTLLRLATDDNGGGKARDYLKWGNFPVSSGASIVSSTLKLYEVTATDCTATQVKAYPSDTSIATSAVSWNNQPSILSTASGNTASANTDAGGGSSCAGGWVSLDTTGLASYWMAQSTDTIGIALRADESSTAAYKEFQSAENTHEPLLDVQYNHPSASPTGITLGSSQTISGVSWTKSLTPAVEAKATDPDGDALTLAFQVFTSSTELDSSTEASSCQVSGVASGANGACTLSSGLKDNTTYWMRVGSTDPYMGTHTWSGLFEFETAVGAPAAASISCPSPYTNGTWQAAVPTSTLACSFTSAASTSTTHPTSMSFSVDGGSVSTLSVGTAGATHSIGVPDTVGNHTITAYTTNTMGLTSSKTTYKVGYGDTTVPTGVVIGSSQTVGSVTWTKSLTPQVEAAATDPDGDTYTLAFQVFSSSTELDSTTQVAGCQVSGLASGGSGKCTLSTIGAGLADNSTYWLRVGSTDALMPTHYWTSLVEFQTAVGAPVTPSISCPSPYASGTWQSAVPTASVACTFTSAASASTTHATSMTYTVDGGAATSFTLDTAGATHSIGVPAKAGQHTITAYTTNTMGITSAKATYSIGYGTASITSPTTAVKTTDNVTVKSTGPPSGTASSVSAQLQWSGPGVAWTNAGDPVTATSASSGASSSITWNTEDATGDQINARLVTTLKLRVVYTYTGGSIPTQTSAAITVIRTPDAIGDSFPTVSAGNGQLGLWTGEYAESDTDVSTTTLADQLSVTRDYDSMNGATNAVTGIFGPGWKANLGGSGYLGSQVDDENLLNPTGSEADGSITIEDTAAGDLVYAPPAGAAGPSPTGTYTPVDPDTAKAGNTVVVSASSSSASKTLTVTQPDGTSTLWALSSTSGAATWTPVNTTVPGSAAKNTTYLVNSAGRVSQILASPASGVSCASALTTAGCSTLTIAYAASTTATSSAPGDYAGRVQKISYTAFDGAANTMTTKVVASYKYDGNGRLVSFTDKAGVTTTYSYTTAAGLVLLTQEQSAGEAPYLYSYDSSQRVTSVQRGPASGSGSNVTVDTVDYQLSPTAAGVPDVSGATVGQWNQSTAPTKVFAVFGEDHVPAATPTSADLPYAQLYFTGLNPVTGDDGYTLDTAQYGAGKWLLNAQLFDDEGNPTTTLGPNQIVQAEADYAQNGTADDPSSYTAVTRYLSVGPDGQAIAPDTYVEDEWSAPYDAVVDGVTEPVRQHTHYSYDEGVPTADGMNASTQQPYMLPTTVTSGVTYAPGSVTTDPTVSVPQDDETTSTIAYSYDPLDGSSSTGPTSGWTLSKPTETSVLLPGSTAAVVTDQEVYDPDGNSVSSTDSPNGSPDTAATQIVDYTAGANATAAECGNAPQWVGLACLTEPAAAPTDGGFAPTTEVSKYDFWLNPLITVETGQNGATRTTTDTYTDDGRPLTQKVADAGVTGSTPIAETETLYDATTAEQDGTATLGSDGTTVTGKDTEAFDAWGRQTSYTNSLGDVTTTSYVPAGSPGAGQQQAVTSPQQTVSYSYDGTDADGNVEHRGLTTGLTVSGVGSYSAAYDADGNLVTQDLPAGIVQTLSYDSSDRVTGLQYSGDVTDPTTGAVSPGDWLSYSRDYNTAGLVLDDTSADRAEQYAYDSSGRLVRVDDGGDDNGCATRQYSFDSTGDRTGLTAITDPGERTTDSTGAGATQETTSYSYNAESQQLTAAGGIGSYVYDGLGRQTTIPAADAPDPSAGDITLGYYDDDLAQTITQGDVTTSYGLDPDLRRVTETIAGGGDPATVANHYGDAGDSPGWSSSVDASGTTTTAYSPGIGDGLAAQLTTDPDGTSGATLDLPDLAGNVAATVPVPATGHAQQDGLTLSAVYDEYGNLEAGSTVAPTGVNSYGWEGEAQRATAGAGLVLMGARVYNPTTGRFTSPDPVPGGNENAYNYPDNPVNEADLTGYKAKSKFALPSAGKASCQFSSCGWQFSALATYEISWAVWAGTIAGPGLICLASSAVAFVYGCTFAVGIWGLVSAYVDAPPAYNAHKCIYVGWGWRVGNVSKIVRC